jgi:hypothetical protein
MIKLRILVGGKVRLEWRTSPGRFRAALDIIRLELDRIAPSRRLVVIADYGDIAALVYRREPIRGNTLSHTA